jgi:hypothetical protein
MKDVLAKHALESFVGRAEEMEKLLRCLEGDSPFVVQIHGIGGVGKSALVQAFVARAQQQGATAVVLDSPLIEPTERGFLQELGHVVGEDIPDVDGAVEKLERLGDRVFLVLETYEVFRLMDTWLRKTFVPALTDNVRVFLVGREPPSPGWLTAPEWRGLFSSIALGPLDNQEAVELLLGEGVGEKDSRRINRFAQGHPLTLKLAASAASERPGLDLQDVAEHKVIQELARLFMDDVADPTTRMALEAASVVRRMTRSLIGAMLPGVSIQETYDKLSALAFVDTVRDGLRVHDAVHEAIAAAMRTADPSRHLDYRRAAWQQLRKEEKKASARELWRYTADMLYLIENPVVREAFFPTGSQQYVVEPARESDFASIRELTEMHEGPDAARSLELWLDRHPQTFHVVRGTGESIAGFYCCFDPNTVSPHDLDDDPLLKLWWEHVTENPVPEFQTVLFLRRWLGWDAGEAPSPVQAACWLDIKRTYMELRPKLRRVYLTVVDLPAYAAAAVKLGFVPLADAPVNLDGRTYNTAALDFGLSSVDGWLAGLVAEELGIEESVPQRQLHYSIESRIGAGGMGVVYRAEDVVLKRPVALKFLSLECLGIEDVRARFLREARAAAALNHPNICTVYEASRIEEGSVAIPESAGTSISEGSPFIAMEFVEGRSLREVLETSQRLPFGLLLDVALQIAEGLAEAHSHRIVHRDLKPQNVMVTNQGRIKILDFGLAKALHAVQPGATEADHAEALSEDITETGMILGTPAYMSPEQIGGHDIDTRSDIFSMGTILYEMATGENPHEADSVAVIMYNVIEGTPDPISDSRPELPKRFEEITSRCMCKNPNDRYTDAAELLSDLKGLSESASRQ